MRNGSHTCQSTVNTECQKTFDMLSERISNLPLFEGVEQDFLDEVSDRYSVSVFKKDTRLIRKNEFNDRLYIILIGSVLVYVDDSAEPIRELGAGSAFGEVSAMDSKPATASVIASSDCDVLEFSVDDLWYLCRRSHAFAINLLKLFVVDIRRFSMQLDDSIDNVRYVEYKSRIDSLTGLFNRRWLDEKFSKIVTQCHKNKVSLFYLMLDIDNFKDINDSYGHDAGDAVLQQISDILRDYIRERDYAVRYGGDEICLILSDTELSEVQGIAERLRLKIEGTTFRYAADHELNVTISIGLSRLESMDEMSDLMKRADIALYQAKNDGRNRVSYQA